jgi:hypothetical protein
MAKQLALIQNAKVAIEDHSMKPAIFFDAYMAENSASLQIVSLPDLPNIPGLAYNVDKMNGRPCWVEQDEKANITRFVSWWNQ